jgi:hypothetical protein
MERNLGPDQLRISRQGAVALPGGSDEQLLADLRDPGKLAGAVIRYAEGVNAHVPSLMVQWRGRSDTLDRQGWSLLKALQEGHRVGKPGIPVPVTVPHLDPAEPVFAAYPYLMVGTWLWSRTASPGKPAITVSYALGSTPVALPIRVAFDIGYDESVDGSVNLGYFVTAIDDFSPSSHGS